jgi:hypothetical protein
VSEVRRPISASHDGCPRSLRGCVRHRDGGLPILVGLLLHDPKHVHPDALLLFAGRHDVWKLGDIAGFGEVNLRQATVFGHSDDALVNLKRVIVEMQDVFATAGLSGVNRLMADQLTNEHLEFDTILKMAVRRAVVYGAAGRLDEAFECLDQAIAFRDPALVHLAVAPQWDGLRGDPRFGERLKAMGLRHPA